MYLTTKNSFDIYLSHTWLDLPNINLYIRRTSHVLAPAIALSSVSIDSLIYCTHKSNLSGIKYVALFYVKAAHLE